MVDLSYFLSLFKFACFLILLLIYYLHDSYLIHFILYLCRDLLQKGRQVKVHSCIRRAIFREFTKEICFGLGRFKNLFGNFEIVFG